VKFLYAYMYHYNPREGTAAYTLPDRIAADVKRSRLSRVIALQQQHTRELLRRRIGSRERVLIEGISRKNADELIARTERDEMVAVPIGTKVPGGTAVLSETGVPGGVPVGTKVPLGHFGELTLSSLRGNTFRAKEVRIVS
jgi:tRNA-2-methylthio-N6-dimethylallyladenosine synthase